MTLLVERKVSVGLEGCGQTIKEKVRIVGQWVALVTAQQE